ncbi:MAG: CYTH domain-containing protein [Eubacterium sp.]|nr:CYTH domain-containing protein [Eubacterium sp.]
MEIERKYLVKYLPEDLESYPHSEISQSYISTRPVIRIRRNDDRFILTVKSSGLISREEYELLLTEEEYTNLSKKAEGNIIEKTRYKIPEKDGLTIELDIFHGIFDRLIYAEVEFPDMEAAEKYNPPAFFGREVTNDGLYQNSSLSRMSASDIEKLLSSVHSLVSDVI